MKIHFEEGTVHLTLFLAKQGHCGEDLATLVAFQNPLYFLS